MTQSDRNKVAGVFLKKLREGKGLVLRDLKKRNFLSLGALSMIENGILDVSSKNLDRIIQTDELSRQEAKDLLKIILPQSIRYIID